MQRHTQARLIPVFVLLFIAIAIPFVSAADGYSIVPSWGSTLSGSDGFNNPNGIAVDSRGNIYVVDSGNDRIQVLDPDGKLTGTWGSPEGPGRNYTPQSISVDASDTVYIFDRAAPREEIIRYDINGNILGRWSFPMGDNNETWYIWRVAVDSNGNVYGYGHGSGYFQIRKFDANGQLLTRWGSRGEGDGQFVTGDGALGTDTIGNVYVGDTFSSYSGTQSLESTRIQKFDPDGQFLVKWGKTGYEPGTYGNDEGEFRFPRAVATDNAGSVYVGDQSKRIQKFDSSGLYMSRIDKDGEIGSVNAIAVDRNGNVYVADSGNDRIVKYTPAVFSANPLPVIPLTPAPEEPAPGIQPDEQLPLANAVDAGGARTYYAIETASGNGDTANTTVMPRNIPASAVLPMEVIPATAVVAGASATVVAAAAATATGTGLLAQLLISLRVAFEKLTAFARGAFEEFILKWLTRINVIKKATDALKRFFKTGPITTDDPEKILITKKEILVLVISPLLLAGAFIFAERTWNLPSAMGIYVVVAAIAMICRDLVQKAVARSFAIYSELRFWSLGTLIMFATGGIFGSVFGSVTRFDLNENLMNGELEHRRKKIAFVALAGPVMSVILAVVFLMLFPVGGIFFLIGITGFSMNLMSATYSMLPFIPMEGADVYKWRWIVWLLVFIPLILAYMMVITPGSLI